MTDGRRRRLWWAALFDGVGRDVCCADVQEGRCVRRLTEGRSELGFERTRRPPPLVTSLVTSLMTSLVSVVARTILPRSSAVTQSGPAASFLVRFRRRRTTSASAAPPAAIVAARRRRRAASSARRRRRGDDDRGDDCLGVGRHCGRPSHCRNRAAGGGLPAAGGGVVVVVRDAAAAGRAARRRQCATLLNLLHLLRGRQHGRHGRHCATRAPMGFDLARHLRGARGQ